MSPVPEPCEGCGQYHPLEPVATTIIVFKTDKGIVSTWVNTETGEFTPPFVEGYN